MSPVRKKVINGVRYEEHYWAGEYVCHVDYRLSSVAYDEALRLAEKGEDVPLVPMDTVRK